MAEVGRAAMHGAARGRGMAAHRNRWCRSKLMEGHWNNIKGPLKLIMNIAVFWRTLQSAIRSGNLKV